MKNELAYFPEAPGGSRYNFLTEGFLPQTERQKGSLQVYSREISENLGRILNLAKLQLLCLPAEGEHPKKLPYPRKHVGKAITKLANLDKLLSFEDVVINGFANSIHIVLKRLFETGFCVPVFSKKGKTIKLKSEKELVVFCLLQQLIYPVLNVYDPGMIVVDIRYKKDKVEVEILRESNKRHLISDVEQLAKLKQRLNETGGSISYVNQQWHILKMVIST